jgi:hypothetical protein
MEPAGKPNMHKICGILLDQIVISSSKIRQAHEVGASEKLT